MYACGTHTPEVTDGGTGLAGIPGWAGLRTGYVGMPAGASRPRFAFHTSITMPS